MIKGFALFTALFFFFAFGIQIARSLTKSEKWALTKLAGYSIMCALLAIAAITLIVIIF